MAKGGPVARHSDVPRTSRLQCRTTPEVAAMAQRTAESFGLSVSNYIEKLICDNAIDTTQLNSFTGATFTADAALLDHWREEYPNIPDMMLALKYADDWLRTRTVSVRSQWRELVEQYLAQENAPVPDTNDYAELPTA